MISWNLTLRQRKLINYLQHKTDFVTGEELAGHLLVSARTIRSDIAEINQKLESHHIQILSKRSIGYLLQAEDSAALKELSRSNVTFLSRDDRVRHIAFRLCLSDTPIDLYDLEDEMYISHTTLEQDINALRKAYVLPFPHIDFFRFKNTIAFGNDERKRRAILNRLFTENWNYNARGNTYYHYQYLEEDLVNLIMPETTYYMNQAGIRMEDINMVILNLTIAIMFYRISKGYELTEASGRSCDDAVAISAGDRLLDCLEQILSCRFSPIERTELYIHISCARMLDAKKLNFQTIPDYFTPSVIQFAEAYLKKVHATFHLDFSDNEDFYITLLQYFRYLTMPVHYFNDVENHSDITRSNLLIELEIAFLVQPLAIDFYGNYLDQKELLYLAFCISGALSYSYRMAPKLKTVIMCHLNITAAWNLKQKVLNKFNDYIEFLDLLPMYAKNYYDFEQVDMVIETVNKTITEETACKTIYVSPYLTVTDISNLEAYIFKRQMNRLYDASLPTLLSLFEQAFWHENLTDTDYLPVIELQAMDFIGSGYVTSEYLSDILRREAILSSAFLPGIVLMYSSVPSSRTCLSVATFMHRVKWNSHKIRTVIMAAVRPEDSTLVFRLINSLFCGTFQPEETRFMKTREELLPFLREHLDHS